MYWYQFRIQLDISLLPQQRSIKGKILGVPNVWEFRYKKVFQLQVISFKCLKYVLELKKAPSYAEIRNLFYCRVCVRKREGRIAHLKSRTIYSKNVLTHTVNRAHKKMAWCLGVTLDPSFSQDSAPFEIRLE